VAVAPEPGTVTAAGLDGAARPPPAAGPAARARWHPLLVAASILVAASVSVLLPVAGTLTVLALFAALRTAGLVRRRCTARRAARGPRASDPFVTALTVPWFLARALFSLLLLAPFALAAAALAAGATVAFAPGDWPYRALAYAAGALVVFYGLGPGSGVPRNQLRHLFGPVTKTPAARAAAVAGMIALAATALVAAVSWPPAFWPAMVPGGVIRFGVAHLGPLHRLGYLAHLSGLPHVRLPPGARDLLRHLG
jgi:hypothetical protein